MAGSYSRLLFHGLVSQGVAPKELKHKIRPFMCMFLPAMPLGLSARYGYATIKLDNSSLLSWLLLFLS